jgi:hypothetical protein
VLLSEGVELDCRLSNDGELIDGTNNKLSDYNNSLLALANVCNFSNIGRLLLLAASGCNKITCISTLGYSIVSSVSVVKGIASFVFESSFSKF